MAKTIQLKAQTRAGTGTVVAKQLRHAGLVPAVIYGRHHAPQTLQLNARELAAALSHSSEHSLVDLDIASAGQTLALIQDIQVHAVKRHILHVDFLALKADEKMHTTVAVESFGEAAGVKSAGGILDHPLRSIEVECLPKDLPDTLTVDVSALNIGDSIHVKDLQFAPGVTVLTDEDAVVFHVVAPTVEAEPEPAAEGDAKAEPEVLKEKKPAEGAADAKKPEGKK